MTDLELFHVKTVESVETMSADRRRTVRQKTDVTRGVHPLRRCSRTFPERGTCGSCTHRHVFGYHNRPYPKCELAGITHGSGTDCRAWWPACDRYEPGDSVSEDAARWTPGHSTR